MEEVIVTLTRPLLGSVVDMSTVTEEQSAGVEGGGGKRGRDKRGERREERKSRKACDILLLHVRFCNQCSSSEVLTTECKCTRICGLACEPMLVWEQDWHTHATLF